MYEIVRIIRRVNLEDILNIPEINTPGYHVCRQQYTPLRFYIHKRRNNFISFLRLELSMNTIYLQFQESQAR